MFGFHEMPPDAWRRIVSNAKRIARKKVIIADIDPDYMPSEEMSKGEPYVFVYKEKVMDVMEDMGVSRVKSVIRDHVRMWIFEDFENEKVPTIEELQEVRIKELPMLDAKKERQEARDRMRDVSGYEYEAENDMF